MKGEVVYLYAFDVASEIATARVREILASEPVPFEIRTDHTLPRDIPVYKPLSIEPTPLQAHYDGREIRPFIHIYEIGVISIALRIPFEVQVLSELLPFHRPTLEDGQTLGQVARTLCEQVCDNLADAMTQPSPLLEPEAYTAFCLTDTGDTHALEEWGVQHRRAIAELLTENQPGMLSETQIDDVLRIRLSYAKTDMTFVDWDAALVIDRTGYVDDVIHVLELANLQLEEYKVMDQRLDRYLNKAYEDVKPHRLQLFGNYNTKLRNLRTLRVDVTKLNDEVTHITKFLGDWYLARVYMAARERFHLNQWRTSVEERLRQLDTLYTVAQNDITNQRMFWLELLIVIFFAIDLATIFMGI